MSELFGRTVKVAVGKRGAPSTEIDSLRIVFKVEKTLEKNPNHASIDIYNLSANTRKLFEEKKAVIRLTAGYGNVIKDIFIGDIVAATTKRAGADIITSIEAADGMEYFQTKEADLSFAPGTKVGQVLDALVKAFGYVKGEVQGVDVNQQYLKGVSFSGKLRDHLDGLLGKQRDVSWSVQDGQLQILPKTAASLRPVIILAPDTGLIGSPFKRVIVNVDLAKKKEGKEQHSGVSLKSLLNAEYVPGRVVQVKAQFVNGNYKIEKVSHAGDTHAVTYYSDLEAVAL